MQYTFKNLIISIFQLVSNVDGNVDVGDSETCVYACGCKGRIECSS